MVSARLPIPLEFGGGARGVRVVSRLDGEDRASGTIN